MSQPAAPGKARPGSRSWAGWPGIAAVLLAILLWVLVKFNQNYTSSILYPALITNLPAQIAPDENGLRKVKINCEGLGSRLFVAWLRRNSDTLELPWTEAFTPRPAVRINAEAATFLRRKLPSGVRMLSFEPDSLAIRIETRTNKRIPLVVQADFVAPYGFRVDSFSLRGIDSVRITGSAEKLKTIKEWHTLPEPVPVEASPNVYAIAVDTMAGVEILPRKVMVYVRPRRYVEAEIDARLFTRNLPKHHIVKYFPPTVKLYCISPLQDLKRVPARIQIPIPFEQLDPSLGVLYPDIRPFLPPYIKLIRWEPRTPAFVVQDTSLISN